jgi:hypothetical protein
MFRFFSAPLLQLVPKQNIKIHTIQIVDSEINNKAALSEEVGIKIYVTAK